MRRSESICRHPASSKHAARSDSAGIVGPMPVPLTASAVVPTLSAALAVFLRKEHDVSSINKAIIVGRVGRDPEKRYTPNADAITSWSVATNRKWKDSVGEPKEHTEWHNVVAFRQLAEQAYEFLVKGRLVYIEGRLETRSWDDKDTGKKMYRTEIIADTMRMLDSRQDAEGMRVSTTGEQSTPVTATGTTDGYRVATKLPKRAVPDEDRHFEMDDSPF